MRRFNRALFAPVRWVLCGILAILSESWDLLVGILVCISLAVGFFMYQTSDTTYRFDNGSKLVVPFGLTSLDLRDKGNGIAIMAGDNVTVVNDSDEWCSLTVSYGRRKDPILSNHAFEDIAPRSSKKFGCDPQRYDQMYVSVSDCAQRKRNQGK